MTETDRDAALLTALTAEHFAVQGVIGASVNEQQARASMFLFSVSGALVAIGLVARSDKFLLFTASIRERRIDTMVQLAVDRGLAKEEG